MKPVIFFEDKLKVLLNDSKKTLIKFFFYRKEQIKTINSSEIEFVIEDKGNDFSINNFQLNTLPEEFFKCC